jgi:TrmH family RNA methyltransferase
VGEVIQAGWDVEAILYAPARLRSDFARDLLSRFSGRIEKTSADTLAAVAEKDNPQGIVAIVRQKHWSLEALTPATFAVALVAPQDPGNVGTVMRTLDAVGAEALFLLDGGVDPYHPTAIRASLGAIFWKPLIQTAFGDFDEWRRLRHCQLIGTSATAALEYRDFTPTPPWILMLGREQTGLTAEEKQAADTMITLPMRGHESSLNLAVAAGILLYAYAP